MTHEIRILTHNEVYQRILDWNEDPEQAASHRKDQGDNWHGGSWQDSIKMLRDGWAEKVPSFTDVVAAHGIRDVRRPKVRWDVDGSEPDIAAYLSGVPESMLETVRIARPLPALRLAVNVTRSFQVSAATITALGRQVLILTEALRTAGVPVEVWAIGGVRNLRTNDVLETRVLIQEMGRPVDVSRLAYWLAHPAALRRTLFALWEQEPEKIRKLYGFYQGQTYSTPDTAAGKADFDEYARQGSAAEVEKWAKEVLARRVGEVV